MPQSAEGAHILFQVFHIVMRRDLACRQELTEFPQGHARQFARLPDRQPPFPVEVDGQLNSQVIKREPSRIQNIKLYVYTGRLQDTWVTS